MLQLCYIYTSYILLRLCVGTSALALFSSQVIRILSAHPQVPEKSCTWLVYWFISLCLHFMTWHDVHELTTWVAVHMWQNCDEPTPRVTFSLLVVCYVQMGMTVMSS